MKTRNLLAAMIASLASMPTAAHDFWIQPATFRPTLHQPVGIHLRVGHGGDAEPVRRDPQRIERFILAGGDGVERAVAGQDGADPAGLARLDAPGLHVVGYRSRHAFSDLPAEKFERYLREEGLERIIERREASGQSESPGLELYSRCAKSLLCVGDCGAAGGDRPLGFRLELVAEENPYSLKPGDSLPVRLLFEGQPLADALVEASPLGGEHLHLRTRTDADGRARFTIPADRPGAWLIASVHMIEAAPLPAADAAPGASPDGTPPPPSLPRADWESLWASLTFEIAAERSRRSSLISLRQEQPTLNGERSIATHRLGSEAPREGKRTGRDSNPR